MSRELAVWARRGIVCGAILLSLAATAVVLGAGLRDDGSHSDVFGATRIVVVTQVTVGRTPHHDGPPIDLEGDGRVTAG